MTKARGSSGQPKRGTADDQPRATLLPAATVAEQLCLACGFCCNGVLFRDVELQAGDDPTRLAAAGLPVRSSRGKVVCPQPCAALDPDRRCRIYADRPTRCRSFECRLFQAVAAGKTPLPAALKIIGIAHARVRQVEALLVRTGESDAAAPLSRRFKRVQQRCERGQLDAEAVDAFGELTLAVHALNVVLSQRFYA